MADAAFRVVGMNPIYEKAPIRASVIVVLEADAEDARVTVPVHASFP
jgi:hypothetical protein